MDFDFRLRELYSGEASLLDTLGRAIKLPASAVISNFVYEYITSSPSACISQYNVIMSSGIHTFTTRDYRYSDLAGVYKSSDIQSYLNSWLEARLRDYKEKETSKLFASKDELKNVLLYGSDVVSGIYTGILKGQKEFLQSESRGNTIENIRTAFRNCTSNQFYIPLHILLFSDYSNDSHANGILINKSKGTVMRIEPELSAKGYAFPPKIDEMINKGILNLVNEIGMRDPTLVDLPLICPQSITRDTNCAFWTLFIFKTILENLYKDPILVINELSKKSPEELSLIISTFKKELVTRIIPASLKRHKLNWSEFDSLIMRRGGKNGFHNRKLTYRKKNGRKAKRSSTRHNGVRRNQASSKRD